MRKAYYIINAMKLQVERHKKGSIPKEPFDLMKTTQNCLRSIQQIGYITPNYEFSFLTDELVGKKEYIILSLGKCHHWGEPIPKEVTFGFIFNAQELISQGALLSIENIDADYERITHGIIDRVASTLPPRPEIPDEILDKFMEVSKSGDHPVLREYLKRRGIDPKPDLMRALAKRDLNFPGCQEVIDEIWENVQVVNAQKLLKGNAALEYLEHAPEDGSCQLLVWKQLSMCRAIGTVQQGEEMFPEICVISNLTG